MTRTPFDQVLQRLGTDSIKWDKAALALGSSADGALPDQSGSNLLLPLSLADMDFQTAPVVVAALEAQYDQAAAMTGTSAPQEGAVPSGDEIAAQVERFLAGLSGDQDPSKDAGDR